MGGPITTSPKLGATMRLPSSNHLARGATFFGAIIIIYVVIFFSIPHDTRDSLRAHLSSISTPKPSHISLGHHSDLSQEHQGDDEFEYNPTKQFNPHNIPLGSKWLKPMRGGIAIHNLPQEEKLQKALKNGWECGEVPETQMVLVSTHWIEEQFDGRPAHGGEIYWLNSFVRSAERLGHPVMLVPPSFDGKMHLARDYHHKYPGCLKIVIADDGLARDEYSDPRNPDPRKLPASRILTYDYFGDPWYLDTIFGPGAGNLSPPLGRSMVITSNPYPAFPEYHGVYYTMEPSVIKYKPIPRALRPGGVNYPHPGTKRQAYVYGKWTSYLLRDIRVEDLKSVADELNIELVMAMDDDLGVNEILKQNGLINHGVLTPDEFYHAMSNCVALIGLGDPMVSPTAYEALYLGVPFLNPIRRWDHDDPADESKWEMQHAWLHKANAPHVYNVYGGNIESLRESLRLALADEFESYVLPAMTPSAVDAHLREVLDFDWDGAAIRYVVKEEERKNEEEAMWKALEEESRKASEGDWGKLGTEVEGLGA